MSQTCSVQHCQQCDVKNPTQCLKCEEQFSMNPFTNSICMKHKYTIFIISGIFLSLIVGFAAVLLAFIVAIKAVKTKKVVKEPSPAFIQEVSGSSESKEAKVGEYAFDYD